MADINIEKLQEEINHVEKYKTYRTRDDMFADVCNRRWGLKIGLTKNQIYQRLIKGLVTCKTEPARKHKTSKKRSEQPPATPVVVSVPERPLPPPEPRQTIIRPSGGVDELTKLRMENEELKSRYMLWIGGEYNPHCVRKLPANGYPTKNHTCPEADEPFERLVEGVKAAIEVIDAYREYVKDNSLTPDDTRRFKQARDIIDAFTARGRFAPPE